MLSFSIRAKDDTVWMRMKEKGNKGAGRTGPDDGIGGEWSRVQARTKGCGIPTSVYKVTQKGLSWVLGICANTLPHRQAKKPRSSLF